MINGKDAQGRFCNRGLRSAHRIAAVLVVLVAASSAYGQKTYVLKSTAQGTADCLSSLRPVDTLGAPAPFVITAHVSVDVSGPYDPNAPGGTGSVQLFADSTGVRSQACDTFTGRISGNTPSSDEQMTFTFDSPFYAQGIKVEVAYVSFALEDPVVFLSSTNSPNYDYIITKNELQSAYVPSGLHSGFLNFRMLTSLPTGVRIDRMAFRETNADYGIQQVVLANPAANLDQVRNGAAGSPNDPGLWVNGNAGQSNSHYIEGYSVPYRVVMTDVPVGPTISVVLGYDTKHSGAHALDFLTHYDRLEPHAIVFGHSAEEIDPTENPSVSGVTVNSAPTATAPIPAPTSVDSPVTGEPTTAFNDLVSDEGVANLSMSLWNATFATPMDACCEACPTPISLLDLAPIYYSGGDPVEALDPEEVQADLNVSQAEQQITVSFVATSPTVILSWGGHIATSDTWGAGNSAGDVSGSPYHMRLLCWCPDDEVGNLGNQDRSLSANAIVIFEACCLPDGTCDDQLSAADCEDAGGSPLGPGTVCGTPEACCFGDGSCSDLDPQCCDLDGGTPVGPGTSCNSPAPDAPAADDKTRPREARAAEAIRSAAGVSSEACCCADATCSFIHPLCCEELGCTPGGPGSDCSDPFPCCGNGVVEGSEECDAGMANSNAPCSPCRTDCTLPDCGDDIADVGCGSETCDGSDAADCNGACRAAGGMDECTCCGDGVVQSGSGETCDDDNSIDGDGCRNNCTFCGDGVVQMGEECDAGMANSNSPCAPCRTDCTSPECGDNIADVGCSAETCDGTDLASTACETCRPDGSTDECTCCGDGVVQAGSGETCDDGNNTDTDGCRNDCTFCGDSIEQMGETCDPPGSLVGCDLSGSPAGGCNNLCRADCTYCGDGVFDASSCEACDDGNCIETDGCHNNCTAKSCGNGFVEPNNGETCDPPGSPAGGNGNLCGGNCTVCGDGITDFARGEQCDDGNGINNDACSNNCTTGCGNNRINVGETCDGTDLTGTACETCRFGGPDSCTCCGDGVVQMSSGETCDDGNNDDLDGCRNNCTYCGDGVTDSLRGEECDDGNSNNNDDCSNDCTAGCGNGRVNTGESCDGTEFPMGSACEVCRPFGGPDSCTCCGDGIVQMSAGETCDDGNNDDLDGCRNNCTYCGDGVPDFLRGEECDDGNANNNDDCSNDCTMGCGNDRVNTGESCDGSDFPSGSACEVCRLPADPNSCTCCGDGIVQMSAGETCDDGNNIDDDTCRNNCTYCGDGVTDLARGEECDDGNANNNDDCSNDCTTGCGNGRVNTGESCDGTEFPPESACETCRPFDSLNNPCTCCGDGIVQVANGETCDDGNNIDDDGCRNDCSFCGDAMVDPEHGESCDPPGSPAGCAGSGCVCRTDCTFCGDGVFNPGIDATDPCDEEQCDDANCDDTDGCRNNCTTKECGDGIVDGNLVPPETCDPPGSPAGGNGNLCGANCRVCGDGVVDTDRGEECDDADGLDDCDCRNNCTIPVCGDGILDALCGEECDAGMANSNDPCAPCRLDCTLPECGDDIADVGCSPETCDGTAFPPGSACEVCRLPADPNAPCTCCGDGIEQGSAGETCDDGNNDDTDACRNNCTFCGDGVTDTARGEQCDDGNADNNDACSNDCTAGCGNDRVNTGESCDGSDFPAGSACEDCRPDCTCCGDGDEDSGAGETCDDGNNDDTDACRNNCTFCGDGVTDTARGEECDDGNANNNDACSNDCTAGCGNGRVNTGESCDGTEFPAGSACESCRPDCSCCGDGQEDPGEQCDDGNDDNNDGCRNDCTAKLCGDSIVDANAVPPETCDPPDSPAGVNGNVCRSDCTVCGDGIRQIDELCDDGNSIDGDGCSNNCVPPPLIPAVTPTGMIVLMALLVLGLALRAKRQAART